MDERLGSFCVRPRGDGVGGAKCGRWNPTAEQVKVLTDLFRAGLRTPTTDEIQKISSQLSFYGKIESKNVFYWFQNHKARERQKRPRVLQQVDDFDFQRQHKIPSTKVTESLEIVEPERVTMQTLQLFPLFTDDHHHGKDNTTSFSCSFGADIDHPTLDLRLSFL